MSMIKVSQLVYEYPTKRALHDVSFEIEQGSITALVGPNGAGKTTLLRCMAALEPPFSGTVHIDGLEVAENPRLIHQKIGYLQDLFGLYETLTVRQSLTYAAKSRAVTQQVEGIVMATAQSLQLEDRMEMKAQELSRGLRQRLAIGQAIIHEPKVLLLDEPASGLDPEARQELSKLLLDLAAKGITLIVSSHILAELEEYSTHMLVIRDGRITEHRAIQETRPSHRDLRLAWFGLHPELEQTLEDDARISDLIFEDNHASFSFEGDRHEQHMLLKGLIEEGIAIYECGEVKRNLQELYLASAKQQGKGRAEA